MTMGEKLKLCEEVERGIGELGCPLPLRAHQICGLDWRKCSRWCAMTKRAMVLAGEKVVAKKKKKRENGNAVVVVVHLAKRVVNLVGLCGLDCRVYSYASVTKNNTRDI